MVEKNTGSNEQRRRAVIEKMWLNFYNERLMVEGVITPQQHKKMCAQISSRKSSAIS